MNDLSRLRRLAGLLREDHDPQTDEMLDKACDCAEDDCSRCNPTTEAHDTELDECIAEAYERFMAEDRKKKPEPVWVNCPECGGSGKRGSMIGSGFREIDCFDCGGEGGSFEEPEEPEETVNEQGEEEDIPAAAAEAGTGLIESAVVDEGMRDPVTPAIEAGPGMWLQRAEHAVSDAIDFLRKAGDYSIVLLLDDAHSQISHALERAGIVTEGRAERSGGGISLTMTAAEADKAAQALNHVGREIFDGEGDGLILIDLANQIRRCL